MLVFRKIKPNLLDSSSLALGMFDGVHLGHQKVILDAIQMSQKLNTVSTVITFAKHPQLITARTPTKLITSLEDRLDLFEELGIQATVILDFNENLCKMTAEEYLHNILIGALNAKSITTGYDHHFGAQKKGNIKFLEANKENFGYQVNVIPPVNINGQIVSSSVIRQFISMGEMESASKLLGRPFMIKGPVIKGMQRGRVLGFPTANLIMPEEIIEPAGGVYTGTVEIDNRQYYSVINVGKRPTFGDLTEDLIEAHIINYSGDLYDKIIEVNFLKKIRNEKKFNSLDELKAQIQHDCETAAFYALNT